MKRFAIVAALVSALGITAAPAFAQNQASALNDQSMVQTLKSLGYQPQNLPTSGAPMFQFAANMPWGGQLPILVEMLRNNQGQYTGYILSAILNESTSLDASKALGLLKANYDAIPCSFAIRKDGRLILQMDRPFNSITAQYLKGDIDFLVQHLAKTRDFWAGHVAAASSANVVAPVNNGPVAPINTVPVNVGPTGPTGPVGPTTVQPAPVQVAPVQVPVNGLVNTVWKGYGADPGLRRSGVPLPGKWQGRHGRRPADRGRDL